MPDEHGHLTEAEIDAADLLDLQKERIRLTNIILDIQSSIAAPRSLDWSKRDWQKWRTQAVHKMNKLQGSKRLIDLRIRTIQQGKFTDNVGRMRPVAAALLRELRPFDFTESPRIVELMISLSEAVMLPSEAVAFAQSVSKPG